MEAQHRTEKWPLFQVPPTRDSGSFKQPRMHSTEHTRRIKIQILQTKNWRTSVKQSRLTESLNST